MTVNLENSNSQLPISDRLTAIDALRGFVMVLMALDHASHAFNAGRVVMDSAAWWVPGTAIPPGQFLLRWVTHLCAPTFIFLAGLVLALSIARRQERGDPDRTIDGFLLKRGILILLLDPLWMTLGFGMGIIFQVLYAIGASFCCMIVLRRLDDRILLAIGLAIFLLGEIFAFLALQAGGGKPGPMGAFLITGGSIGDKVVVIYPLMPWLAYMITGWVCGRYMLLKAGGLPIAFFIKAGLGSLAVFGVLRGLNAYGNMGLLREGRSIIQWLHVSKYPPGLTFAALELGLMFLLLALLFAWYRKRPGSPANPLLVFGRTPLFFYVIHVHLLVASAHLLGMHKTGGLIEAIVAALLVMIILYPLCRRYGNIKKFHPGSILRYL
jgi:uncharacterized membrane protein